MLRYNARDYCNTITSFAANTMYTQTILVVDYGQTSERRPYRVRRLTPRECLMLMDLTPADVDKITSVITKDSVLYKLAGNSIVVKVLENLFQQLYRPESFSSSSIDKVDSINLFD